MESRKFRVLVNTSSKEIEPTDNSSTGEEFVQYRSHRGNGVGELKNSLISGPWKMIEVSEEKLQESLRDMTISLGNILTNIQKVNTAKLSTIEVGLEISAEGGVTLIGSATAGVTAAITLKFDMPD